MSVGRRPVTKGFGLENLNLDKTARGNIQVDGQMQTSVPGVYACGDLTGFSLLAHTAVREAEVAVHAVLGKKDCMSYRAIPGVVYTNPEIAGVGDTEETLQRRVFLIVPSSFLWLIPVALLRRMRALTVCASCCWRKMIPFGSTCAGQSGFGDYHAGRYGCRTQTDGLGMEKMVFPHPTVGEIFKEAL